MSFLPGCAGSQLRKVMEEKQRPKAGNSGKKVSLNKKDDEMNDTETTTYRIKMLGDLADATTDIPAESREAAAKRYGRQWYTSHRAVNPFYLIVSGKVCSVDEAGDFAEGFDR